MSIQYIWKLLAKLLQAVALILLIGSIILTVASGQSTNHRQEVLSQVLAGIVFVSGAPLCIMNFYLFMREFIHFHIKKLPRETFQYVSGIPILGSLFVAISLKHLYSISLFKVLGILLIVIDTSGIFWIIPGFLYMAVIAILKRRLPIESRKSR